MSGERDKVDSQRSRICACSELKTVSTFFSVSSIDSSKGSGITPVSMAWFNNESFLSLVRLLDLKRFPESSGPLGAKPVALTFIFKTPFSSLAEPEVTLLPPKLIGARLCGKFAAFTAPAVTSLVAGLAPSSNFSYDGIKNDPRFARHGEALDIRSTTPTADNARSFLAESALSNRLDINSLAFLGHDTF